jgi:curli production assembly/transport component CsgG
MRNFPIIILASLILAGCGPLGRELREQIGLGTRDPSVVENVLDNPVNIPAPASGAVTVAVYHFRDLTGQRRSSQTVATLSSAVTQGADAYLVRTLQTIGNGRWFRVVERGGLDNLIKERQLIRQMRELYEGPSARQLPPLVFAGIIFEGGIIGYDSNLVSGGAGARVLGIGGMTEYRQDEVIVNLRAVSVATGEVLASVTVSKTVVSWQDKISVLRFNQIGTRSLEAETGAAFNESMNQAVQLAILGAVTEIIFEGERRGIWQFAPTSP